MAEVACLTVGALSLAALFDSVTNNFDRIHIRKEFEETYQRYLLQLEVLRLRFHRWSDAVSGEIDEASAESEQSSKHNLVKRHLTDLQTLFEKEKRLSKPYHADTSNDEANRARNKWLLKTLKSLSIKHGAHKTSVRNQVRWAIRGRSDFEQLVKNISTQLSNLEQITASQTGSHLSELRAQDATEIWGQPEASKDDGGVRCLCEAASDMDREFVGFVQSKAPNQWIGNVASGKRGSTKGSSSPMNTTDRF